MWQVIITYKWYQAQSLGDTQRTATFNIENASGMKDAAHAAEAIFRMNEETVEAEILDFDVQHIAEEFQGSKTYLVTVGYTLEVDHQVTDHQQIFSWKNAASYGEAVRKAEVVFGVMNPTAKISGIKAEEME